MVIYMFETRGKSSGAEPGSMDAAWRFCSDPVTLLTPSPRNQAKVAAIIELLESSAPHRALRVLEIGCGVGNVARPIAQRGYDVLAIDLHGPSVELAAQQNNLRNLAYRQASHEDVDIFAFDAIVMSDVLEHIRDYKPVLNNIAGRMKPGASFILHVPNGWCICELACRPSYFIKPHPLGQRIVYSIKKLLKTKDSTTANETTPHVNFFTARIIKREFSAAGLNAEAFRKFFFLWTLLETFFSERGISPAFAEKDWRFSQKLPAWLCSEWVWRFRKTG